MPRRWKLDADRDNLFLCTYGAEELIVKQVSRGSWFARIRGEKEHARWGSKEQIREDITYFVNNCSLPRARHRVGF